MARWCLVDNKQRLIEVAGRLTPVITHSISKHIWKRQEADRDL